MCDKRNIDHAISRHNPEAKKTLLAYYCCHTISNVEYDKRPNKWFLDHFPTDIYGYDLRY